LRCEKIANFPLSAIGDLAAGSAKQKAVGAYHTNLFAFPINRVGIFKIMLITITRACVHFSRFYKVLKSPVTFAQKYIFNLKIFQFEDLKMRNNLKV